jgi:hypothetical protein
VYYSGNNKMIFVYNPDKISDFESEQTRAQAVYNFLFQPKEEEPEECEIQKLPIDLVVTAIQLADRGMAIGNSKLFVEILESNLQEVSNCLITFLYHSLVLDSARQYQVMPIQPGKKHPPNHEFRFDFISASKSVEPNLKMMLDHNPVEEYRSEHRLKPLYAQKDLPHVLGILEAKDAFSNIPEHRGISTIDDLLELLVQPVVDKFQDLVPSGNKEQFLPLMKFAIWYFEYRRINEKIPNIQEDLTPEAFQAYNSVDMDYASSCDVFEKKFRLVPTHAPNEAADLYMNILDRIEMSPAFAALFTNLSRYNAEKPEYNELCLWSQPVVNHRSFDVHRVEKLRDGFFHDPKNHTGLSHEEYTCFPYIIAEIPAVSFIPHGTKMRVESMVKVTELSTNRAAESLANHSDEVEAFYEFVYGEPYKDPVVDDASRPTADDRPFYIFASAIHKMNQKFEGLGSMESLRRFYGELLHRLAFNGSFPTNALSYMCLDYGQLFHACRIAFQATFRLRLGMIDGGHRIITALGAIYNVLPSLQTSKKKCFLLNGQLNLGLVCQSAHFKVAWPNCPTVDTKQNYDLMVSSHYMLFIFAFLFRRTLRNRNVPKRMRSLQNQTISISHVAAKPN